MFNNRLVSFFLIVRTEIDSQVKAEESQMTDFSFGPIEAPKSQGSHFDQAECLQAPLTCLVKR